MNIIRSRMLFLSFLFMIAGCAAVQPTASFPAVQQISAERLGKQVRWSIGSESDQEVDAMVNELLSKPLDVDDAVQVALLCNRNLQATYEELGVAQAELVQAGLLTNPVLSGEVKFFDGGTNIELSLVQSFLDVLYIPLRKSLAESAMQGATLGVSLRVMDTASEVRATFIALQAAEQLCELHRTSLSASEAAYDLARRIHAAGNTSMLELVTERAAYEEAKLQLATVEAESIDLREHLTGLMGLWGAQTQFKIADRLAAIPDDRASPDGLERIATVQSLDLKLARTEIEQSARQLGVTTPFGGLSEWELGIAGERETDGQKGVGPAISLPIPIFSQNQPAIAAASARVRQASQRYYALAVEIRSGVRAAYQHMFAARQRAEYLRSVIIPLRQTIVAESQKQYNGMFIGAFQLLQAKRDEVSSAKDYIEALRDYWLARAELDQILAGRFVPSERPFFTPTLELKRAQTNGGH